MSASNWASLGDPQLLAELENDHAQWTRFVDKEVRACAEPGALDGGTHILIAARRQTFGLTSSYRHRFLP